MFVTINWMKTVSGNTAEAVACLSIPNEFLYLWHLQTVEGLVRILNEEIKDEVLMVKECVSVEERLRKKCQRYFIR